MGFFSQATTDDQVDTATSAYFVQNYLRLVAVLSQYFAGFTVSDFAFQWIDVDNITHVHFFDVSFKYQRSGIFHGVEEDWRYFRTNTYTAAALVRHAWQVFTEEPQYRVSR